MAKVQDARYIKCEHRIQEALLNLLSKKSLVDIGVSELSKNAHVSRATFYAHYDNVVDVFDQLVQKALSNVQSFEERFSCNATPCKSGNRSTFCEQLRSNGEWADLTRDPRFFASMMSVAEDDSQIFDQGISNITRKQSEALRLFQMSGCYALATSKYARQKDWSSTRKIIDTFIEGGLNAIRSQRDIS